MKKEVQERFTSLWERFFNNAELPITFYYTDDPDRAGQLEPSERRHCFIELLNHVRKGKPLRFEYNTLICPGSKKYLGYSDKLGPNFECFLSYGIPGKLEGERFKKNPDLVKKFLEIHTFFEAPAKYIVFKRWDNLDEQDEPEVVIFYAKPDVIAGLFTLANFDIADFSGVMTPFGSACMSTVLFPYLENRKDNPKAVIGTFDPCARPFIGENELSFALPLKRLVQMMDNMEESFLITPTWKAIQERM